MANNEYGRSVHEIRKAKKRVMEADDEGCWSLSYVPAGPMFPIDESLKPCGV